MSVYARRASQYINLLSKHKTVPFTPLALSPFMWFDASDVTTLSQDTAGATPVASTSDPVGRWADKSGNNNHVTQATSSSKPAYTTGVQNALAGLSFDGGDFLDSVAGVNPVGLTMLAVCKTNLVNAATYGIISARNNPAGGAYLAQNTTDQMRATRTPGTITAFSTSLTAATSYIVVGAFDTLVASLYVNGNAAVLSTSSAYTGTTPQIVRVAGLNNNNTATLWAGFLMEIIVCATLLSPSQISQAISYFNTKWGVY